MAVRKRTWTSGGMERSAWVAYYRDGAGDRRQQAFKTKKAADAWWTDTRFHVQHGLHTADSASITVAAAAENWIKRIRLNGKERSTIAQYRQHVDYHIVPLIGAVKLSKLSAPGMQEVADRLLETHSRAMAKKVLASIKGILSDAQRRGHVAQNVAQGVIIETDKRHQRRPQVGIDIPSKTEIQQILEAAKEHAKGRWRQLLVTAVFTGLRASELRGLPWANVDFKAKVIHVRQRADRWNQIGNPKSRAGERTVPMPPMVQNVLKEWRLACPKGELDLVFPNGKGNVEGLGNIYRRGLAPVQVARGIVDGDGKPKYGMHALRHFYASWLIDQGFRPDRVQDLLGHSSITMTFDVYRHLFPSPEDDHAKLAAGELAVIG